jgi:hypothetical protein
LSHLLAISLFVSIADFLQQKVKGELPTIQFPFIVQPAHQSIFFFVSVDRRRRVSILRRMMKSAKNISLLGLPRKHSEASFLHRDTTFKRKKKQVEKKSKEESKSPSHFMHDPR